MCSIDEAWAGQNFSGKPVVSQSDIHKAYMSLPDDIMTHNNQFSLNYNEEPKSRDLSRGINSKYSREARVPKINRNIDNANINFSSELPQYNNYGGINPRPDYMEIYDNSIPSPIMAGENFTDITNAYNVSSNIDEFMNKGEKQTNSLLEEDTFEDRRMIDNKFKNKNNNNNFTNIKQTSKYDSSDRVISNTNYSDTSDNDNTNNTQIMIILKQVINKLDNLEYNFKTLHKNQNRNMYDIILYILFGMILSFILYSILSSKK